MIRFFDIFFSAIGLIFFSPIFFLIFIFLLFETEKPIFSQKRVGINLQTFTLFKFRTMKSGTLSKSTHLIEVNYITYFGYYIRKFKLDELPQLLNVFIGNMSLVGPRPCLPNQKRLINQRNKRGLFKFKPGITGLAQITGINMSTPTSLAKADLKMMKQMNLFFYFFYILKTFLLVIKKKS